MTASLASRRLLVLLVSIALAIGFLPVLPRVADAASADLFFSEYIEGSSNNKALEIYNGTGAAVNLSANRYAVQMYFNGSDGVPPNSAPLTIPLTGTVAAGDVFVLAQATADPAILAQADQTNASGWFNGDDAVLLVRSGTPIDVIGQVGVDPGTEWGTGDASTADNTLQRKASVTDGDPIFNDTFDPAAEWNGFPVNTFSGLGTHSVTGGPAPVVADCGPAVNALQGASAVATVSASDADGVVTDLSISSITPTDPGTITRTSQTPATTVGGTATAQISVAATTPPGMYSVNVAATTTVGDPGSCTLTVNVLEVLTIGAVQGPTTDDENGAADRSPFAPASGNGNGQTVAVRGIVTERIRLPTSSGGQNYAFFLQSAADATDGDATTSDGIYVFSGSFTTLRRDGGGSYFPVVGDQVVLRGPVAEFFNLTQLSNPFLVSVEATGLDVDTAVTVTEAQPPDDLGDANRYWERHEAMRFSLEAGASVTAPRNYFASTQDGEVWVIRGDHPLAQRSDPYARRVFRDVHPLDDIGAAGSWDNGNGMRIMLTSHGLKWNASSNATLIEPARTFDTSTVAVTGGLTFTFDKYAIEVEQQPGFAHGVDPSANAPVPAADLDAEYTTATYNVENLYDFRDDPFDGCDFLGNGGCPGVSPPFDYVPLSQAAYDQHLSDIASQIVNDLHSPDILMVQEAEDQDICTVTDGAVTCGGTNGADGQPDSLQDLAVAIAGLGGPVYAAAYDRNGADDRGITAAFLYRTDRVELHAADASHPVLGSAPSVDYPGGLAYNTEVQNPKALNAVLPADVDRSTGTDGSNVYTRAPQVGYFRVWRDGIGTSVFTDLYAISNHFSSGPDGRVGQRTEQAAYNAAIIDALRTTDDGSRIVTGGDFNVFPRPDDPFAPGEPYGDDDIGPSDQLAPIYATGMHNLYDILVEAVPQAAYSYTFEGQAQTLDSQFVSAALLDELNNVRVAHVNADFPAAYDGDVARGASDHDPQEARYDGDVTIDRLRDLVAYYLDAGMIGPSKLTQLTSRLDKAELFYSQGKESAGDAQLIALGDQARDLSPRFIDPVAAAALEREADRLAAQ
jgi:predicted extracellular nuclease